MKKQKFLTEKDKRRAQFERKRAGKERCRAKHYGAAAFNQGK